MRAGGVRERKAAKTAKAAKAANVFSIPLGRLPDSRARFDCDRCTESLNIE
jgi:hypothetical protein